MKERFNFYIEKYPFLKMRATDPLFVQYRQLEYKSKDIAYFNAQGILAYEPNQNVTSTVGFADTKDPVYYIQESTDSRGRRLTHPRDLDTTHRKKHLLVLGCSFTWGDWLADKETLPWLLNERQDTFNVYNLGGSGHSPADIAARIDFDHLFENVQPIGGRAIYVFYFDHIRRFFGTMRKLHAGSTRAYYEEVSPHQFIFKGIHRDHKPIQALIAPLLTQSNLAQLLEIDFPPITSSKYHIFARFIKTLEQRYHRKFGSDNLFSIVLYPNPVASIDYRELKDAFKAEGLNVIDYSSFRIFRFFEGPASLADGHPTGAANKVLADMIIQDLLK
ncbi:MAG: hypothetical protein K2Q26_01750 [Bdellovibrionales bacterium]|nr:hypothetical protein [Bdellovibrionales bacterium]